MFNNSHPLYKKTGADILSYPIYLSLLCFFILAVAKSFIANWLFTIAGVVGLSGGVFYILKVLQNPRIGAWSVLIYSFTWSLIARYVAAYTGIGFQFGLGIDGLLALTIVAMIFSGGQYAPYQNLRNGLMIATLLWFFFIFLQLFNPHASSRIAWVFTIRSYALYLLGCVIVCNVLLNEEKDLDRFLLIFVGFSILGALYGMRQLYLGLDYVDSIFIRPKLDRHMLFGKLRVFSFYENAGQAGVTQGHAGVIANILFIHEKRRKHKLFYFVGMLLCYYGMAISGTRGALAVPAAGIAVYLVWCKMPIVTITGTLLGGAMLFILMFTNIGQSNYTINRMRTAFNPDDPSFQYRLEARAHYAEYMNKHAFGWGIGSAGYWGNRFNGDDNIMKGTDGGYVQLQAEIGYIGLYFYWVYFLFVLGSTFWMLLSLQDSILYPKILALCCGVIGLLLANYGNSVIYQLPSNITISMSLAYIWMSKIWVKGQSFPKFKSKFNTT
ncbi:MAG: hypothetical protein GY810_05680 [Aureispira sp.]|nr:hypothetical protein [Aureispira sp.]